MVPGNLIQPVTVIFAIPGTVVTGAQENLVGLVTGLLKQLEVSLCFKFFWTGVYINKFFDFS